MDAAVARNVAHYSHVQQRAIAMATRSSSTSPR
jgi:hypothetical protein